MAHDGTQPPARSDALVGFGATRTRARQCAGLWGSGSG